VSNSNTLVIFEGNINITRAAHILKISNIIAHISKKVTIAISRITYEALLDLAKEQLPSTNIIILDSKQPVISHYKYSLLSWLKEWILHLIQLLRLFIAIRNDKPENAIIMGTINIPAILLARLFCKRSKMLIFVFPSRADGLPNTILEAFACESIVLATPIGGISDVIKDNVTGYYIYGSLEPINIANHILRLLNVPKDRLKEVSLNGKRFVEKYYGYTATLSRRGNIIFSH